MHLCCQSALLRRTGVLLPENRDISWEVARFRGTEAASGCNFDTHAVSRRCHDSTDSDTVLYQRRDKTQSVDLPAVGLKVHTLTRNVGAPRRVDEGDF
jgi:hypothetical protein